MKKFFIFLCFTVFFASFLGGSVFAQESTIPDKPNEYPTLIYLKGNTFHAVSFNYDDISKLKLTSLGQIIYFENTSGIQIYRNKYVLSDGVWQLTDSTGQNGGVHVIINDLDSYVYSDITVYDRETGELVFPEPPVETPTLEEVIQEETTKLQAKTVGTMKTLTACGVGLLALLIGLVILPKILFRFL